MTKKAEQMYSLVKSWEEGNQTKADFCKEEQINIHTFTYWVQKHKMHEQGNKPKAKRQKFIPLQVKDSNLLPPPKLELCYPNGLRLRIESLPDIAYLKTLLQIKL